MDKLHTRSIEAFGAVPEELQTRAQPAADGKPAKITGYAAVFNSLSFDMGGFKERILPGAFSKSLASGADVRALVAHDNDKLLGRTSNGTLRLGENPKGLWFEVDLPDTSYARDLIVGIQRRDYAGASFGFLPVKGGDSFVMDGNVPIHEVREFKLLEVTATSIPAYGDTTLSLRDNPELAQRAAAAAAANGWPMLRQRKAQLRALTGELPELENAGRAAIACCQAVAANYVDDESMAAAVATCQAAQAAIGAALADATPINIEAACLAADVCARCCATSYAQLVQACLYACLAFQTAC